jgi:hypothetical protein
MDQRWICNPCCFSTTIIAICCGVEDSGFRTAVTRKTDAHIVVLALVLHSPTTHVDEVPGRAFGAIRVNTPSSASQLLEALTNCRQRAFIDRCNFDSIHEEPYQANG